MPPSFQDKVLTLAGQHKKIQSPDIVRKFGVSRQFAARTLSRLVAEKKLVRFGTTNRAFYVLPKQAPAVGNWIRKNWRNQNLEEFTVLKSLEQTTPLLTALPDNVRSIFDYAFSEMLNNAIEHSASPSIRVEVGKNQQLSFFIRDRGIGVFRNIMRKKKLASELDAMQELLKGKTTTAPEAHSGEGIFFTSKIADVFFLESFGYKLLVDNRIPDVFVEQLKYAKQGTTVFFQIGLQSPKHISDLFQKFQSRKDKLEFDKTEILVKLYTLGTVHVSRSQARRLLHNLDKFKLVVLDFDRVPAVGQAFADEIFRVFARRHPAMRLQATNMNPTVRFMVERAKRTKL